MNRCRIGGLGGPARRGSAGEDRVNKNREQGPLWIALKKKKTKPQIRPSPNGQ